jgi:hypothetical protein
MSGVRRAYRPVHLWLVVDYRYEQRRGDEVVATGHLNYERPLEVGLASRSAAQPGIVRTVEPVLGEREGRKGLP